MELNLLPPYDPHLVLRLIRYFSGVRQEKLASILGVSQGWISKLEKGMGDLTAADIQHLRDFFGITADGLLDGWIDFESIRSKFGTRPRIPKKHLSGAGSRVRLLYGLVAILEKKLGQIEVIDCFKRQHIPIEILANPKQIISIHLFFSLIEFAEQKLGTLDNEFWSRVASETLMPYGPIPSLAEEGARSLHRLLNSFREITSDLSFEIEDENSPNIEVQVRLSSSTEKIIEQKPSLKDGILAFATALVKDVAPSGTQVHSKLSIP